MVSDIYLSYRKAHLEYKKAVRKSKNLYSTLQRRKDKEVHMLGRRQVNELVNMKIKKKTGEKLNASEN